MKAYATISISCLSLLWGFLLLTNWLTKPITIKEKYPGLVRIEPGHAIITDKASASINPLSRNVLLAETLNREVSNYAFNNEILAQRVKITKPEKMHELMEEENSSKFHSMLKSAQNKGITWNPSIGGWGMFLLQGDKPPQNYPIYGVVELPGGKESSTFLVERDLNILLAWMRGKRQKNQANQNSSQEDPLSLLKEVLNHKECPITSANAVELYGLAKALNIGYDKELGLFLSPETRIILESDEFQ